MKTIERMRLTAKNQSFNKIKATIQRNLNAGVMEIKKCISDIDIYTLGKLEEAGFDVEIVDYLGHKVYRISWYEKD